MNQPFPKRRPALSDIERKEARCILVIDDEEAIRRMVGDQLEFEGFEVWSAVDGQQALDLIDRRGFPHLAVVDINMPGMSGFEFCQRVQEYTDLPVIMLSAMSDEKTIIRSLLNFAEDYITKPFSPRQLAARVERVLRRIGDFKYALEPVIKIDEFLRVDLAHQTAYVDGKPVKLTRIENKILFILLRNTLQIVTTRFLLERVWPEGTVSEAVLRVHVHRLRSKIEHNSASIRYIITERGLGYRFSMNI